MLLTVSMAGERLEPLIIWKCVRKPADYPFKWYHNKKAWMTSDIFQDYLAQFNDMMVAQNRHVILFVDGALVHNKLPHYSNIVTDSPPPNNTSAT
jgi:hypothetical protein